MVKIQRGKRISKRTTLEIPGGNTAGKKEKKSKRERLTGVTEAGIIPAPHWRVYQNEILCKCFGCPTRINSARAREERCINKLV
jgi:hypothetical protein